MNKRSTQVIVEIAVMISLAFVLEFTLSFLPKLPQGGRFSISLLPIIVLAWKRGVVPGLIGGLSFAVLNMMLDSYAPVMVLAWDESLTMTDYYISVALDYVFAFGLVGLVGFIRPWLGESKRNFAIAVGVAYLIRFVMHFFSGLIVFDIFADWGFNPALYSFLYNLSYIAPSGIVAAIIGYFIYERLKDFFETGHEAY